MENRNLLAVAAFVVVLCVFLSEAPVTAARKTVVPDDQVHAPYQSFLVNANDFSVVTATLEMTFRLFDSEAKSAELLSETYPAKEVIDGEK